MAFLDQGHTQITLPLELNFEQDFNEKNGKMSATNEIAGTVYGRPPTTL